MLQLTSYGGLLSYSFNYEATLNCTDDGAYLANNDVIIEVSRKRIIIISSIYAVC